ncbi:hypothetical protein [Algicola sagamiensis]|uniref:hypothetical protein n=1 Tax=Algicola sagamiensis TaxID=163869 RepID=UPI00036230FF|nr:hypothetical protein [Algicola sagamiensis]
MTGYRAPLRNYQQMVRVVRNDGSGEQYHLASAYGDGPRAESTDLRLRTLDEMNLPSTSPRRPAPTVSGGDFSTRTSTVHYHELNAHGRGYFDGSAPQITTRTENMPGTKFRTDLGQDQVGKKIQANMTHTTQPSNQSDKRSEKREFQSFNSK